MQAATTAIPISLGRPNGRAPIPWWNDACKEADRERKKAERALRRNHNAANLIAFRRLNALCRRTFKKARKEAWIKYISTININTTLSEIWKKVNKIRGKFSKHPAPLLRQNSGDLTDDPSETSRIFSQVFSGVSNEENYPLTFLKYKRAKERKTINFNQGTGEEDYNRELTWNEFQNALSNTKETSPGPDSVTYSIIQNAHPLLQRKFLSLFNEILISETFPNSWKVATVIPIPKPNKDHTNPLNFRPISLTSCLCKLLEKIINSRLTWYLEKNNCLDNIQSGFRSGRSTTDCLVALTNDLQEAVIQNKHTIVVFFDLMKAYDTSWKHGILTKLYDFGLRGHLPIMIQNFSYGRKIEVKVGPVRSDPVEVLQGVPQGSVLSCTLFAVAMNEVTRILPPNVKSALYVDDLTIYASGTKTTSERQIQMAINRLSKWCNKTGFQFSAPKTISMHICRQRNGFNWCRNPSPELTLGRAPIPSKEEHTYLGLVIDQRLKWDKHVQYLRKDCQRRLTLFKHISHADWGADTKSLLRIYQSFIPPKIEYGVEAYGSACASTLAKLEPIQNQGLRTATGAFRTSPIDSLEVLAGFKSLKASREEKFSKYLIRALVTPSNTVVDIIRGRILPDLSEPYGEMTLLRKNSFLNRSKD